MNHSDYNTFHSSAPADQAEKNRRVNRKILKIVGFTAGGLLVFGLGAGAGASTGEAKAEPAPVKTVEVEAEPEVITETKEVEVEVEKEVEVTPQACIDIIDAADQVIEEYSEAFFIAADIFEAAEYYDLDAMEAATISLGEHTDNNLEPALSSYYAASEGCKGAAK